MKQCQIYKLLFLVTPSLFQVSGSRFQSFKVSEFQVLMPYALCAHGQVSKAAFISMMSSSRDTTFIRSFTGYPFSTGAITSVFSGLTSCMAE